MSKLLIIDDETSLLEGLQSLLESENYEVKTATNGADALKLLESETFDLILLDQMMPFMTGTQFLAQQRTSKPAGSTPVILMSASKPPAGATGQEWEAFLSKPFDLERLLSTIEEVLVTSRG